MDSYFKYKFGDDINFEVSKGEFVTIIGNNNDLLIHTLLHGHKFVEYSIDETIFSKNNIDFIRKNMGIVLYKHLNIFVGENVGDEIVFGLESLAMKKDDIRTLLDTYSKRFKLEHLLDKDPNSLGSSDKTKLKILSYLIMKPGIIVIDNLLCELDASDKELVINLLKEYVSDGGIVINFTNDIEETLFGEKVIIIYDKKLVCEGKTLSVLNEEKLLKRLHLGIPFIVELNKYLMDYQMINKYYMTNEKLVNALWK